MEWPDLTLPPLNLWNFPRQPNLYKENNMSMYITLTDLNGTYSISFNDSFDTIDDYIESLIKPILYAAGFAPSLVDAYIKKDITDYEFNFNQYVDEMNEAEKVEKKLWPKKVMTTEEKKVAMAKMFV